MAEAAGSGAEEAPSAPDAAPGPAAITLPMSAVVKAAKAGMVNTALSSDAKQALHDAALVFVSFTTAIAADRTRARGRKGMTADDVVAELHDYGFKEIASKVAASVQEFRASKGKKRKRAEAPAAAEAPAGTPAAQSPGKRARSGSAQGTLAGDGLWGSQGADEGSEESAAPPEGGLEQEPASDEEGGGLEELAAAFAGTE